MTGGDGRVLILGGAETWGTSLRLALASRGARVEVCALDDCSAREISLAVTGAEERLGAIDALVYCAGGLGEVWSEMLLDIDEPEWDALMNRRLKGFFLACKFALPYLLGRESPRVFLLMPEALPTEACGLHARAADAACLAAVARLAVELSDYGVVAEALVPKWEDGAWLGGFAERCR